MLNNCIWEPSFLSLPIVLYIYIRCEIMQQLFLYGGMISLLNILHSICVWSPLHLLLIGLQEVFSIF